MGKSVLSQSVKSPLKENLPNILFFQQILQWKRLVRLITEQPFIIHGIICEGIRPFSFSFFHSLNLSFDVYSFFFSFVHLFVSKFRRSIRLEGDTQVYSISKIGNRVDFNLNKIKNTITRLIDKIQFWSTRYLYYGNTRLKINDPAFELIN